MSKQGGIKIAMVAGEPSGDLLASKLMEAILARYPEIEFVGIGGPRMIALGFNSWYSIDTLSVNGIFEVLKHYPAIARMRRELIQKLIDAKPDLFIGIDSPDFNLDLEDQLKTKGIATMHYISPTIWAWRSERIYKIAKACDHILVLFPFEAPLYEKEGIMATYVGHPLADDIANEPDTAGNRKRLGCEKASHVFALLPGSRNSEVHFHADLLVQTAKKLYARYPECVFLMPAATPSAKALFEAAIVRQQGVYLPFQLLDGQSAEAIQAADIVICASGTATLETALWKKPMVVTYKTSWLTWQIAKRMVKLDHVALPNILSGRQIVPEYLQERATPNNLANSVIGWVEHPERIEETKQHFAKLHQLLKKNASQTAANAVIEELKKRKDCV